MHLRTPTRDESIAVIAKLAGDACNINCYYCYEKRSPHAAQRVWLEPHTLRRFLDHCAGRPLRIVLHGGEPLLIGRARMALLTAEINRYDGPISLAMQTNGLLLDEAWLDFFDAELPSIDIAVSLDGPRDANRFRVNYRDQETYDGVIAAINLLAARGRDVGLAMTVTRLLLGRHVEVMELLTSLPRVRAVRLSPCLDYNVTTTKFPVGNAGALKVLNGDGEGAAGWSTTPLEYAEFVMAMFDLWKAGHWQDFLLEPLFSILLNILGRESPLTDWSEMKEPYVVSLYPGGAITSSDEISTPGNAIGHVDTIEDLRDVLGLSRNPALREAMSEELEVCGSCTHQLTCHGGSLADRMRLRHTPWNAEYCRARKRLIDHVQGEVSLWAN